MSELPHLTLQFDSGREFESTPENTSLFRFVGALAIYNHIFMETEEQSGTYLFRTNPNYEGLEQFMIANKYPLHDNLREVAECDKEAYELVIKKLTVDVGDTFPEDWEAA